MADRPHAIRNDLNRRAREVGLFDQELTLEDLAAVRAFYNFTCLKCGKRPATSIDHVKPLSEGGQNTLENLQLLCTNDNKAKGNKEEDYRNGKVVPADYVAQNHAEYNYEMNDEENNYESANGEISEVVSYDRLGRKHGGGRKLREATILRRRLVEDKVDEAEASFAYLCAVRDNPFEPSAQRLAAAEMILDRVLGKATETSKQQKEIVITVIREQRESIGAFARLALGSGTD
jgi:hypothetical protein